MLKLTTILKEDYIRSMLDNPTNRRLLNIIAKNNDLSTIYYNKSNPFIRQMRDVKNFIKSTLYIEDAATIAQLLWLIFLNGDIDYLKDDLDISTDFQVYEIYYYTDMEEEQEEREIDCSECDGYGQKTEDCDMCQGTGEEETGDQDEDGDPIMQECPDCEGTGEIDNDCDWCAGGGYEQEDFIEYTVEEWRNVYVSKKENIKAPPTISYPYNSREETADYADPMDFNRWIRDIPKEELILITENFMDNMREEYESYVEEESGRINSFESLPMEIIGFSRFLRDNIFGDSN